MKFLYLDNFRGFSDAYIPIKDVTFLVGENSSGKTSVLSIAKIITSPRFWFGMDFDTEEIRLGHFQDLVSIHSKDKSYFRIGFAERVASNVEKGKSEVFAFLMTFRERGGMPVLLKYSYISGDVAVTVHLSTRRVGYRVDKISEFNTVDDFIHDVFSSWLTYHRGEVSKLTTLTRKKSIRVSPDLLDIVYQIDQKLRAGRKPMHGFRLPGFSGGIVWLAPIRTKPHRTYDEHKLEFSAEGEHTPYLIRKILGSKGEGKRFSAFLEQIGKSSGLFDTVAVKRYGRTATSPFELDIILNSKALSISNVGYGVSQSLPVFVELFARPKGSWLAVQQPEVHLHPRAQAALGDVLYELAISESKSFLVETHSDYLLDRFRTRFRKNGKKPDAQILYFERSTDGNRIHVLPIDERGELPEGQPKSYQDFFIREQMRILGLS